MDELTRRAYAAYFRTTGEGALQPAEALSGAVEHDGLTYVVLRNNYETLAVYRVRPQGILKRLKRWPAEIDSLSP